MPGWKAGSWAYHGDDGKKFSQKVWGKYNETYGTGDTICCGIDFNSNTVDFYKNGICLDELRFSISRQSLSLTPITGTAFEGVKGRLFPVIGIGNRDVHLRIRFSSGKFPLFPAGWHVLELE